MYVGKESDSIPELLRNFLLEILVKKILLSKENSLLHETQSVIIFKNIFWERTYLSLESIQR